MSCATTRMHLEIAVLYEVGEKDKYCVTSSIEELKMIEMNLLIKQTHRLNEFMVTKGKERTSLVAQTVKRLPTISLTCGIEHVIQMNLFIKQNQTHRHGY